MRKIISFLLLSFVVYALQAQIKDPVKFKTELTALSDTEAEVVFTATMDKGWPSYILQRWEPAQTGLEQLRCDGS